ncbi:hypothetical protein [Alloactinosynnema sp. L-07]|nr:hypothetical protein [Alloactinosynnema sp. L-07]
MLGTVAVADPEMATAAPICVVPAHKIRTSRQGAFDQNAVNVLPAGPVFGLIPTLGAGWDVVCADA